MNATPISDPNTMMPATAATQNVLRQAIFRSYSGFAARFWRMTNRTTPIAAIASKPMANAWRLGTVMKLRPTIRAPIMTADRTPPRLSTRSVDSFTCAGTCFWPMYRARTAKGRVTRNTDPHAKYSSSNPETSGPSIATPPPSADHIAMERVRAGPDQSAVMSASVVG